MNEKQSRLLDKKALGELHPALKNKYRVDYLVRIRAIPIIAIRRRIYFDEVEIQKWIENHKIKPVKNGGEGND